MKDEYQEESFLLDPRYALGENGQYEDPLLSSPIQLQASLLASIRNE